MKRAEGDTRSRDGNPTPYRGYYYRDLTGQATVPGNVLEGYIHARLERHGLDVHSGAYVGPSIARKQAAVSSLKALDL